MQIDASTAIALAALVFSFGTTAVSYKRSIDQDIANTRRELRDLLQRLVALPRENMVALKTYEADAQMSFAMGSSINQENSFLIAQIEGILGRLPPKLISAGEYYSIALAFQNSYHVPKAVDYLRRAHEKARRTGDFNTEVAALRTLATLNYLQGDILEGRRLFEMALGIFERYPTFDAYTRLSTNIYTRLAWATAERNGGDEAAAREQIGAAETLVAGKALAPGIVQLLKAIAEARTSLHLTGPQGDADAQVLANQGCDPVEAPTRAELYQ